MVAKVVEEVQEGVTELPRVQRLAGPLVKVVGDELVKVVAANDPLQVVHEVETLLVGHLAVDVFGVHIVVLDDELGVLWDVPELLNGVLCN